MAEEPVTEPTESPALAGLDQEDVAALLAEDSATGLTVFQSRQCRHCGGVHSRACPRIRRLRYTDSGNIAEVEYFPPGMWAEDASTYVIWPEMLGIITDSNGAKQ